jgi:TrmH RNA methyltransferase
MSDSPWSKGPPRGPRPDKRTRERERGEAGPSQGPRREQGDRPARREHGDRLPPRREPARAAELTPASPTEQRIYGLNACLALFSRRPGSVRKVWLLEERIPDLKEVLAYCVKNRLGYTLVEGEDLERLSGSAHHEGVVFGALPAAEWPLSTWLQELPKGPALALWLDGVGNPHNLGAIVRSSAHFGANGILLPKDSHLHISGAAARVAEGGAEFVPMVRLGRPENAFEQLRAAGFTIAATVVRNGASLFKTKLPERLVYILGAEQSGVDSTLAQASALRLAIPGRGAVESLNVASAASVLMAEWLRQH